MNFKIKLIFMGLIPFFLACSKNDEDATCDPNLSVESSVTNASCDQNNGSIVATGSGGKGALSYSLNGNDFQSSNTFSNLPAGSYTLTIKDENNCTSAEQVTLTESSGFDVSVALSPAGCGSANGAITTTASGGVEPYQYKIDNGIFQNTASFSGLSAGDHTITVMDASNCTTVETAKVLSGVSFSASISNIIQTKCALAPCHGGSQNPNFTAFGNVQANAARIKTRTGNKTMPPPGATQLTNDEIAQIACWVDDGALQN